MLFRLHYWLITSGACALNVLMGVYLQHYTDASHWEIGLLFMIMPFFTMVAKPVVCSKADRETAHRRYLQITLCLVALSYVPFILIPSLGPKIYQVHPRICWYLLVVLKIIGDSAFASAWTLGDALAINYSRRVGEEFCTYRVWGTISWMFFGLVIGSINEVSFLPKYVPAFMVLIGSCLLNIFVVWLWPAEYFKMVRVSDDQIKFIEADDSRKGILMSRNHVFEHMKSKLMTLLSCTCFNSKVNYIHEYLIECKLSKISANLDNILQIKCDNIENVTQIDKQLVCINIADQNNNQNTTEYNKNNLFICPTGKQAINFHNKHLDVQTDILENSIAIQESKELSTNIGKRLQLQILWLLAKRYPSFFAYIIIFCLIGLGQVGLFFFFMDMENVCATQGTCQFSQLAGFVQVTMASSETILFFYIKLVKKYLSYDDMCAFAFLCNAIKWLFYGFFWRQVSPLWALLAECMHGLNFGFYLTLVVEISHQLASQVNNLLPELHKRGLINEKMDLEKLRSSLSATMQALMSSCTDGLGRGVGALLCGFIIETYSYRVLWLILGAKSTIAFAVTMIVNIYYRFANVPKAKDERKIDEKLENLS